MNICFLDNNLISYDCSSLEDKDIRGAERAIINLSIQFNKLGHKITVLNNIKKDNIYKNIRFKNIKNYNEKTNYDLAITNNDINNLNIINADKKIAISHSIQTIEKFIRKNQLFPYLKHKPKIFLLGEYHKSKRSYPTRLFGSEIINWAVDDDFLKTSLIQDIDHQKALFTSYPDRNLDKLVFLWINHIFNINNKLKLYITPSSSNYEKFNIFNRKLADRKNLLNEMLRARVFLIPGHVSELYCIAAEEAKELCIPIVTFGIGALSERVEHGKTGLIAKNDKDFANYTLELFNNNSLWNEIRSNLTQNRNSNNWEKAAKNFLNKCAI